MNSREISPSIFKTVTATASGNTAVWTPTSGKKFRLMMLSIQITADAATAGGGVVDITLQDGTTAIGVGFSAFCPSLAGTTFGNTSGTGWVDLGSGYLSLASSQALNVNLSAALTSGKVRVNISGTEE